MFDATGRSLYFLTARSFTTVAYSALEDATFYPNSTVVASLALPPEWPTADGGLLERHAAVLPLPLGNYADLRPSETGFVVRRLPRTGATGNASPLLHVEAPTSGKEQVVSPNAQGYDIAASGGPMLVWRGPQDEVFPSFQDAQPRPLGTTELAMRLAPTEEWRQIFHDAWRLTRDFLYDPDMRGLDWRGIGQRYEKRLANVTTRSELTMLLADMLGELGVSHVRVGGGDSAQSAPTSIRLLGADFTAVGGYVRVSRVLQGAPWDLELRSPLATAGVTAGAYLLRVNGQTVDVSRDLHALLVGVGATATLTVSDRPTFDGSRVVTVSTLVPAQDTTPPIPGLGRGEPSAS